MQTETFSSATGEPLPEKINPLTLGFRNTSIEEEFRKRYFRQNLAHHRRCHLISILFYLLVGGLDFVIAPGQIGTLVMIRSIIVAFFLAGFISSYLIPRESYSRIWQYTSAFYVVLTGLSFIFMSFIYPGIYGSMMFIFILFSLVFGYTFIRLRFTRALISGSLITIAYLLTTFFLHDIPMGYFLLQVMLLVSFNLLGSIVAYYMENSARKGFRSELMIENQRQDAMFAKVELEKEVKHRTAELESHVIRIEQADQEREKLSKQLLHSQKMEAIGHLAGGIAHDFNNLLTIINGFSKLTLDTLPEESPSHRYMVQALDAGQRAESLTSRLLTFGRQQIYQPQTVSINEFLEDIRDMLQMLLDERMTLELKLAPMTAHVEIDPSQFEQVIVNLTVNAHDAMPEGGRISIETDTVYLDESFHRTHNILKTGTYVRISFSDTGMGMDPDVKMKIFDPFFTTKDVGKGTGLGLSTSHSIIDQCGGYIYVYSEQGEGTTFKIYLPAIESRALLEGFEDSMAATTGGSEKIMIVEDEPALRDLVAEFLVLQGYTVIKSEGPLDALDRAVQDSSIDLVITDVVMPEMMGNEMAAQLKAIYPDCPVLYMSGYTDESVIRFGVEKDELNFIQKPFSPLELGCMIRRILDKD